MSESQSGQEPTRRQVASVPDAVANTLVSNKTEQSERAEERTLRQKELSWTIGGVIAVSFYTLLVLVQLVLYQCNSIRQLRAYINPTSIELHCQSCGLANYKAPEIKGGLAVQDVVTVIVQNGGQTPANQLWTYLNWRTVAYGYGLPPNFEYKDIPPSLPTKNLQILESHIALNPGKERDFSFQAPVADIQQARQHKLSLWFYGHADYLDIYKYRRSTTFCWVYVPDVGNGTKGFSPCEKHNESK